MPGSDFEKKVQQSMDELKLSPSAAVWDAVEAALPEKRRRRWLIFLLIFAALFTGAGLIWMNSRHEQNKLRADTDKAERQINLNQSIPKQSVSSSIEFANKEKDSTLLHPASQSQSNTSLSYFQSVKRRTNKNIRINISNPGDKITGHAPSLRSKATSSVKIDTADTDSFDDTPVITSSTAGKTKMNVTTGGTDTAVAANAGKEKIQPEKKIIFSKTDSSKTEIISKQDRKKEKHTSWQFGVEGGVGISNLAKNISGSSPLYSSGLSQGLPPSSSPGIASGILPGLSLKLGLSAERKLSKHLTFKTGIGYAYLSNFQQVGSRVDSGSLAALSDGYYYRNDNSSRYLNHYHLAEIPLVFRIDLAQQKKHSFFLEAGPGLAYLIGSNALMYRRSYNIFVNGNGEFNRLLMNIQAGAGMRFAQNTKTPFSIGIRAQYGITPVFRNSETTVQHPVNALLILQVPFKK